KEDSMLADVRFVGQRRGVDRDEQNVVSLFQQLGRQRVITKTTAAVHTGRARCDGKNPHTILDFGFWILDCLGLPARKRALARGSQSKIQNLKSKISTLLQRRSSGIARTGARSERRPTDTTHKAVRALLHRVRESEA